MNVGDDEFVIIDTTTIVGGASQNDGTLSIENAGELVNTGTFINESIINNFNRLSNGALGTLINNNGTITNIDRFINGGLLINDATINNTNLFVNNGTLNNTGAFDNSGGSLDNSGTLSLETGSTFTNSTGVLTNKDGGSINLGIDLTLGLDTASGGAVFLRSGSQLNILSGATATNEIFRGVTGNIRIKDGGRLENTSGLSNFGVLEMAAGSTLDNTGGFLDNSGGLQIAAGSALNNAGGILDNRGNVVLETDLELGSTGAGTIRMTGGRFLVGGGVTLSTTASHTQTNNGLLELTGFVSSVDDPVGTLQNRGEFIQNGLLQLNLGSVLDNSGVFTNNNGVVSAGVIDNAAGATFNNNIGLEFVGAFNNAGMLNNTVGSQLLIRDGGTLRNQGTLVNAGIVENRSVLELKAVSTFDNTDGILNNNDGGVIDLGIDLTLGSTAAGAVNLNTGSTLNVLTGTTLTNQAGHTLDNQGTLALQAGSTFDNTGGVLNNNGVIDLGNDLTLGSAAAGTVNLNTDSTLNILSGGTLTNQAGHTQTNEGTLNNNGTLALAAGSTFDNTGGILNNDGGGVIDLGVDLALGSAAADTVNLNAGSTLNVQSGATLTNQAGHTQTNEGTLNNSGTLVLDAGSVFENGATVINEEGQTQINQGTLNNNGTLTLIAGSTFDNTHGILNNNDGGVIDLGIDLTLGSTAAGEVNLNTGSTLNVLAGTTLTNQAGHTLDNQGTLALQAGSAFDNTGGILNNNAGGVIDLGIDLTLSSTAAGIVNLNTGGTLNVLAGTTLTNQAGHTQDNQGRLALQAGSDFDNTGGIFNNNAGAVIEIGIDLTLGSAVLGNLNLNAEGVLKVQAGATLTNQAGQSESSKLSNDGTFNNDGTFTSKELGNSGTLNNTGTIDINNLASMTNTGTINNAGTLNFVAEIAPPGIGVPGGGVGGIGTPPPVEAGEPPRFINIGTFNNTGVSNHDGEIDNSGVFIVAGTGILNVAGQFTQIDNAGTFNIAEAAILNGIGDYIQSDGALTVDGTMTQGSITINGGSIGGSGIINGDVAINGGSVGPGNSPGTLTINGDLIIDTGVLSLEIGDLLTVTGLLEIGPDVVVELFFDDFTPEEVVGFIDLALFFDADNQPNFTGGFENTNFQLFTSNAAFVDDAFALRFGGEQIDLFAVSDQALSSSPVPEPGTLLLFGLGLAGLGYARRCREGARDHNNGSSHFFARQAGRRHAANSKTATRHLVKHVA